MGSDLSPRSLLNARDVPTADPGALTGSVRQRSSPFSGIVVEILHRCYPEGCGAVKPVDFQSIMELAWNLLPYKIVSCATA